MNRTRQRGGYRVEERGRGRRRYVRIEPDRGSDLAAVFAAIGAVLRWLWRYRSELAPPYTLAGLLITGAWLHATHPGAWPIVAAVAAPITAVLALARIPRRVSRRWPVLNRRAERVWAACVIGVSGAWLSVVGAVGVRAPWPFIGLLAMLALGSFWWWHRDRRDKVRVRRIREHFPETAAQTGLDGAEMGRPQREPWGWVARVRLRRGQHAGHALHAIPALESAIGTRVGALRVEPIPHAANEILVRAVERDPHAQPLPWPEQVTADGSITAPVLLGVFEDATPVMVGLAHRHTLIGGTTGSGKSGLLNVILAVLSGCRDVLLWGIDLKQGMELRPWARCLDQLATTGEHAEHLLSLAVEELDRRAGALAAAGHRIWQPSPTHPALVVVIDEYAELSTEARALADSIARRGRAVAVTLLVATQRPTQQAMGEGTAVRSQMDVRICLRVRERRDVDLILGQGALKAGWDATQLDAPGKFLLSDPEHPQPWRARGYLITDAQVAATATRNARHPLAPITATGTVSGPYSGTQDADGGSDAADRELRHALSEAGPDGLTIADMLAVTGWSKSTLYRRLRALARQRQAEPTGDGRWRATNQPGSQPGDGRDGVDGREGDPM